MLAMLRPTRRFRQAGLQPKSVMMSKQLEDHAESRFEVESGHRLSSAKVGAKYDEAQAYLKPALAKAKLQPA